MFHSFELAAVFVFWVRFEFFWCIIDNSRRFVRYTKVVLFRVVFHELIGPKTLQVLVFLNFASSVS